MNRERHLHENPGGSPERNAEDACPTPGEDLSSLAASVKQFGLVYHAGSDPLDLARKCKRLMDSFGLSRRQLAEILGVAESMIPRAASPRVLESRTMIEREKIGVWLGRSANGVSKRNKSAAKL